VLVISDTNILSSFSAGESLHLLFRLFPNTTIHIPPAVHQELQTGLAYGQKHIDAVLQAIDTGKLQILPLSKNEQALAQNLPKKLNTGECEAIALSKNRKCRLLSNDKQAVRYCQQNNIQVLDLPLLLRLLWTRSIVSQTEIKMLLDKMKAAENLQMSQKALATIFAPR
jgi:predicted nucleic acid-binding protein